MRKNRRTVLLIFTSVLTLMISCKKEGELIMAPSFGKLAVKFNTPANNRLLLRVDDQFRDTLKDDGNGYILETGEKRVALSNLQGKTLMDTTIHIERGETFALEGIYNGSIILLDNKDPDLKPQADSLLVRFITTDQLLPDVMDIEISLYDFAGTIVPLSNKKITGIRKEKFSAYIQLPNPNVIDPSFESTVMFYVIEGYDATPGGNRKKVMSIDEFNVSYLAYQGPYDFFWVPNNIISFGIGPAPEDGSTTLRDAQIIFQRVNPH